MLITLDTDVTSDAVPGPVVQLTTLLVNISVKFQTLISERCQYFLLKKCKKLLHCMQKLLTFFQPKNTSVFKYKIVKHLTLNY